MRIPALTVGLFSTGLTLLSAGQPASVQPDLVAVAGNYALGDITISTVHHLTEPGPELQPADTPKEAAAAMAAQTEPSVRQPVIVTVQTGDSLGKIAENHQTTIQRLYDANPAVVNPDVLHVGQQIRVPFVDEALAARPMPAKPVAVKSVAVKPAAARTTSTRRITTSAPAVASGSVWDSLAACESGGNWSINTGNGYYGGLQFSLRTWQAVGGQGYPHQNSREEQIHRGQILQQRSGWGQWPHCAAKLGLI